MNKEKNVLSQAIATLSALRKLTLAYVAVNCVIAFIETWVVENPFTVVLYAPFSVVFCFCFYCKLLDVDGKQTRSRLFGKFALRFLFLMGFVNVVGLYLLPALFSSTPAETELFGAWGLFYLLNTILVYLLTYYFFETVLPAQIVGMRTGILAAPQRVVRQNGYLLPRYFGLWFPISVLAAIFYGAALFAGATGVPITPEGDVGPLSLLLLVLSGFLDVLAQAVFMVLMARVYLNDLRERGEIPAVDEEVFA